MIKYLKKIFFFYHATLYLAKDLCKSNQIRNDEIVKHVNNALIELKKDINIKKIPENENPNKIVDIVEKFLDFNKQQKCKRLPLDLARVARIAKVPDCKVSDRKHIKLQNIQFKDCQYHLHK